MANRVRDLKRRLAGLYEVGHQAYRVGEAERAADLLEGIERIETVELPAARAQARVEAAVRAADPDREPLSIPEDAPAGWVSDPGHWGRLSPALQRRIAEDDAREQVEARRETQARAQVAEADREAALMESWRADVGLGLATVADLPRYLNDAAGGRTPGEADRRGGRAAGPGGRGDAGGGPALRARVRRAVRRQG
jgi:hypothetical protein